MGRILQVTQSYAISVARHFPRVTGTLQQDVQRMNRRELQRALLALERAETLPGEKDFEGLLEPPAVGAAWVRPTGLELWVLYRFDDTYVSLRQVTRVEPKRVEPDD